MYLCQESITSNGLLSLYNTEGVPFSSEKGKMFLGNWDTYFYSNYLPLVIASLAAIVQSWSGKNRIEGRRREYTRGGGVQFMLPREILKFSFSKIHILRILREN